MQTVSHGIPADEGGGPRLASLLRITRAINQVRELRPLLALLASEASAAIGAERSTVFLYDESRRELWSFVAEGLERQIWFDAGSGIAGRVFRTRTTSIVNDTRSDPSFNPEIDRRTGFSTRSALTVPIIDTMGKATGVFQAVNKMSGDFDGDDAEFLEAVAGEAAVTIENVRQYEKRRRMFESFVSVLADSIEARDPLTAGHSLNVMRYSSGIAANLGMGTDERRAVEYAALLHDYGKIGVPDDVLRKPGPLDQAEAELMRSHVERTASILAAVEFEEELALVPIFAAEHHERLDGSGYPRGLSGDRISRGGRIIAVADVFEALTSVRHYRDPMSHSEAFEAIASQCGRIFDREAVAALGTYLVAEKLLQEDFVSLSMSSSGSDVPAGSGNLPRPSSR